MSSLSFDPQSSGLPNLIEGAYKKTSPEDISYNCMEWALGDDHTQRRLDPFSMTGGDYWPSYIPQEPTVENFVKVYSVLGKFETCPDAKYEEGYEKIALYIKSDGYVHHVARQSDNKWKSKLGDFEDIEHVSLQILEGESYGKASLFLKRPFKKI